jgi:hypothetical protein
VEKKRRSQVGDGKESAGGKKGRKNASKSQDEETLYFPDISFFMCHTEGVRTQTTFPGR